MLVVSKVLMLFAQHFIYLKAVTSLLEYFTVNFLITQEDGETRENERVTDHFENDCLGYYPTHIGLFIA